jgi:hypothetical protein
VKRKLFGQIRKLDIDAYVLGAADSKGNAHIYQIWPAEKDLGNLEPDLFNQRVGRYCPKCN